MNTINKSDYNKWLAHTLATTLKIKCDQRQQGGNSSGDSADDSNTMESHLSSVLAEESSFLYNCSSFMDYLASIGILLKKAFTHKTEENLIILGWKLP